MDGVEVHTVLDEPVLSWSVQSRKTLGRDLREKIGRHLARAHAAAQVRADETLQPDAAQAS
jgi:hypothetical protein